MAFSLQEILVAPIYRAKISGILILLLFLSACSDPKNNSVPNSEDDLQISEVSPSENSDGPVDEAQAEESADSDHDEIDPAEETALAPQKEIVICMANPPKSLYPHHDQSFSAETLRYALYEPLITQVGYDYQPSGLEQMPSLANGAASINKVMVEGGQRVVDHLGNIVLLLDGVTVINSAGEEAAYTGSAIEMEQMVVDFTLKPMVWSDGSPVTAEDSVFSYNLAAGDETAFRNSALAFTASYEAVDESTVRWVGWPGFRDQTFFTNVWQPLPSHQDEKILTADLKDEIGFTEKRLSSGPFVIAEFRDDGSIILQRNDHYFRQEQGYPLIDKILVRFGSGEEFLAAEQAEPCDVITSDVFNLGNLSLLETAAQTTDWRVITAPGMVFEYIAFGVNPVSDYAERRPDWFEDPAVRQAMTMCTDRERMVQELTKGFGKVINTYVPDDHPLYPDDLAVWPYDPARANALLDDAGYQDFAGDGRRQDISSGVPMTITLGTNSESPMRLGITEMMKENLADCGIPVETYNLTAGTWYSSGPEGRLFGRQFDLASLAWLSQILPDCGLFTSANITGPEEFGFGGWQNTNITGWSNEAFDQSCHSALLSLYGGEGYGEAQQEALRIFGQELPAMPLFTNVKIAAIRNGIENVSLDSSQQSMLWNIYEWDVKE